VEEHYWIEAAILARNMLKFELLIIERQIKNENQINKNIERQKREESVGVEISQSVELSV